MTLRTTNLRTTGEPERIGRPAGRPVNPLKRMPVEPRDRLEGTWRQARPGRIRKAFDVAQSRDPGGWHVVGSSTDVGRDRSVTRTVLGREVVLWRLEDGTLQAGPGSCPHLGALLDDCEVMHGQVYCRWHGLALGEGVRRDWLTFPAHDDGVLVWVRLPTEGETLGDAPRLTDRPPMSQSFATVVTLRGRCEPQDVIANRLDPWHGTWYHPYAFSHLTVDDSVSTDEVLVVDVAFRVTRQWGVPVRAEFTCPDARTIVMTIMDGEGAGSVVETHATSLGTDAAGRPVTVMTEATIAHSPRRGFQVARAVAGLIRPAVAATQRQLWVDDLAYAERRYELRARGETYGGV
ncbi:nitrite reductase/ring-hydroxylating ferredoxin subunit [Terracoccus luteus]|jgi:hypothetical protein|uniref:Nitrite reductase/ring-hydroxylating ferredoxin subunit n=1 Tax=Terracoccus luteus TaxID=53356 RepID=A0A495XRW6_9MICO|nr:DUF5914 domain-containing protein [Terracoccus luteus]RKT76857.1 nitrite reductase/ring-hydroxylating ferredoxin subunit [Terracoccus luteus]